MSPRTALLFLVLGAGLSAAHAQHSRASSLDGTWTLRKANSTMEFEGVVPGGVYTDLRRTGILEKDIFYRFNDEKYRWVSKRDWIYSRKFEVSTEALSKEHQVLVFHGVDTMTTVYLNGERLGATDNMFVRYRFDVKGKLKIGSNELEVRFVSPVRAARARAREQAKKYVVPPKCTPPAYRGECGVNHLRKMQASFAWDWGPAFPSVGLWKSVELECYDEVKIRAVSFETRPTASSWEASIGVHFETGFSEQHRNAKLYAVLRGPNSQELVRMTTSDLQLRPRSDGQGTTRFPISFPKSSIKEWWPNGMGEPNLYELEITLEGNSMAEAEPYSLQVGFRTVELVQEPVSADISKGLSFYFRVNGKPMFAKGSNWIPVHVLPELGTDEKVANHLLQSAKETNMNMLRVWGGGVYESDFFYKLADKLGILIWQDFMFACAMYPTGEDFLQSVRTEVKQQFLRLNHHPSIAVWSANNENEAALRDSWYGTDSNFTLYKNDYVKLYVNTIRDEVWAHDKGVPFLVSSPSNGRQSEEEGFVAKHPYSPLYGDDHHYDYLSDGWNPEVYHNTRFGSEYGFQSLPSLETLKAVAEPQDLALGSEFSLSRQHHPGGNQEMGIEIQRHLPLPDVYNGTDMYPTFVYYSQINQAMSTKTETEFLRRSQSVFTPSGEGLTMGALYWQLNDVWQAPTWASIDFAGRWKMVHYFAQDFFAPVLVSPTLSADGQVAVDVVTDLDTKEHFTVVVCVMGWDAFGPRWADNQTVNVAGPGSTRAWNIALSTLLKNGNCGDEDASRNCYLVFGLMTARNSTRVGPLNFIFPAPLKHAPLQRATLEVQSVSGPAAGTMHQAHDYLVRISSSKPAPFLWLEAQNLTGRFSSNGFVMVEPETEVLFHTDESVTPEALKEAITITALNDRYPAGDAQSDDANEVPSDAGVDEDNMQALSPSLPLAMSTLSESPLGWLFVAAAAAA